MVVFEADPFSRVYMQHMHLCLISRMLNPHFATLESIRTVQNRKKPE